MKPAKLKVTVRALGGEEAEDKRNDLTFHTQHGLTVHMHCIFCCQHMAGIALGFPLGIALCQAGCCPGKCSSPSALLQQRGIELSEAITTVQEPTAETTVT